MKRWLFGTACFLLMTAANLQPAQSTTLTFTNTGNFLDTFGVNPIGVGTQIGTSAYYSGNTFDSVFGWVTPSGLASPTGGSQPSSDGTTVTANKQSSSTLFAVPYNNSTAFPNQFFRNFSTGYTGPWTLIANNASTSNATATVNTPALAVTTTPLPNTAVAISGSTLAPTISWTIPTGTTIPTGSVLKESVFQGFVFGSMDTVEAVVEG